MHFSNCLFRKMLFHSASLTERMASNAFWEIGCPGLAPRRAWHRRRRLPGLGTPLPLLPIRSEAELDRAASAVLNGLLDRDQLDAAEQDVLDVLGDLIERYEDEAHPIDTSDLTDAEMLAHLIEA